MHKISTFFFLFVVILLPHSFFAMDNPIGGDNHDTEFSSSYKTSPPSLPSLSLHEQKLFDEIALGNIKGVEAALKDFDEKDNINKYNKCGRTILGWLLTYHEKKLIDNTLSTDNTLSIASLLLQRKEIDLNQLDGIFLKKEQPIIFTIIAECIDGDLDIKLLEQVIENPNINLDVHGSAYRSPLGYAYYLQDHGKNASTVITVLKAKREQLEKK